MELRTSSDTSAAIALDTTEPAAGAPAATRLRLPSAIGEQIAHLAELSYPYESCGLLLGHAVGQLVAVERVLLGRNLSLGRLRDRYTLDPKDFLEADRMARAAGLAIVGIWHSHPDSSARPSASDRSAAWEGYSYLIVSITALGTTDFRCWRLQDGRFREESLLD